MVSLSVDSKVLLACNLKITSYELFCSALLGYHFRSHFFFGAFFTFFDMAVAKGWFPPAARVALGLFAKGTFGYIGYYLLQRGQQLLSDIVSGLGAGVLFLSIGYASFSEHIMWSQNILLLSMIGCGSVLLLLGYKLQRKNALLLGTIAIAVLLVLLGFVFIKQLRTKQKHDLTKEVLVEREKGSAAIFKGIEEERKRIAQDLHDGIGQ